MDRTSTKLAYLIARGLCPATIIRLMDMPLEEVEALASKFGFVFVQPRQGIVLTGKSMMTLAKAAEVRDIPSAEFIEKVLNILGDDPILLRNVIDDGK